MFLQALGRHTLAYRSCRVGAALPSSPVNVFSPSQILCDVDSQVCEAAHPLHSSPINPKWCVGSFGDIQHEAALR